MLLPVIDYIHITNGLPVVIVLHGMRMVCSSVHRIYRGHRLTLKTDWNIGYYFVKNEPFIFTFGLASIARNQPSF
jgi:hypothetical protein